MRYRPTNKQSDRTKDKHTASYRGALEHQKIFNFIHPITQDYMIQAVALNEGNRRVKRRNGATFLLTGMEGANFFCNELQKKEPRFFSNVDPNDRKSLEKPMAVIGSILVQTMRRRVEQKKNQTGKMRYMKGFGKNSVRVTYHIRIRKPKKKCNFITTTHNMIKQKPEGYLKKKKGRLNLFLPLLGQKKNSDGGYRHEEKSHLHE